MSAGGRGEEKPRAPICSVSDPGNFLHFAFRSPPSGFLYINQTLRERALLGRDAPSVTFDIVGVRQEYSRTWAKAHSRRQRGIDDFVNALTRKLDRAIDKIIVVLFTEPDRRFLL